MKQNDLLWAINSVVEAGPCEYVGHWSSARALLAVVELHKPFMYEGRFGKFERCSGCASEEEWLGEIYPCPTIQAIEKGLQ